MGLLQPEEGQEGEPEGRNEPMPFIQPPHVPDEDFFRFRIDGLDVLDEIAHQLRGEVPMQDGKGGIEYKPKFDRWVNEEGIGTILHILYSNGLNKNVFLANLSHDEITFKLNRLKKVFALLIYQNYHRYEIKKEMRSLVVNTLLNQIHLGLSRCEGGKEAEQLSTATTRVESHAYQESPKQEQRGMRPSMFNPRRWGGR